MSQPVSIASIAVDSFRGLRGVKLGGLKSINLLFGPNNSGKSTILEAVALFSRPLDLRQWLEVIRSRDPGGIDEDRLISLRWCFPMSETPGRRLRDDGAEPLFEADAVIRGSGLFPGRELQAHYRELEGEMDSRQIERRKRRLGLESEEPPDWLQRGAELTVRAIVQGQESESARTTFWEDSFFSVPFRSQPVGLRVQWLTSSSYHVGRSLIRQVHLLKHAKYRDSALEMLRQFDPLVRDFDIGSSGGRRPTIYVLHERLGYVPLTVFGDGMRRALALVVAAASAQDGILLLDEFEAGIHFSALQGVLLVLFRACQHFNVEVFATTHNLEAIDSVLRIDGVSLDDVAAFRLPSKTTDSVVARYSGQALYELRYESGMEVR